MRSLREEANALVGPRSFTLPQVLLTVGICLLLCLFGGCYDGQQMIESTRTNVLKTRDAEIDLGNYETTMPRDSQTNAFTELSVHIFGTVPRYRVAEIKKQLRADEYRLRHSTLAALRGTTREELAEPDLAQFRARIEKAVNEVLTDAPVKQIGFYDVRLQYD